MLLIYLKKIGDDGGLINVFFLISKVLEIS